MIHGLDTGFLVAAEVAEHTAHKAARETLARLVAAGDQIAIAPQLLAEFMHVVTDPRRFAKPLDMAAARNLAEQWWTARDAVRVFPDDGATRQFLSWLQQFSLGRKRLLDTLLAATYLRAGVQSLLTTNPTDFGVFGVFTCITPQTTAANPWHADDKMFPGLLAAIRSGGEPDRWLRDRSASWESGLGAEIEAGKHDFRSLEKHMLAQGDISPNKSGRQEAFENLVNRFVS